jgi:hypothetical protein
VDDMADIVSRLWQRLSPVLCDPILFNPKESDEPQEVLCTVADELRTRNYCLELQAKSLLELLARIEL